MHLANISIVNNNINNTRSSNSSGSPDQEINKMTPIFGSSFANMDVNEVNLRLEALKARSGYPIVQQNGQRRYGPPPDWQGDEPTRGCEVFIGKLPRNMIEDEIIPIFERIGRLYRFRLMMDFSGTNRGFAFATYTNKTDAKRAVADLDNYEIRRGRHIGVVISVDNCRLYLGRLPRNKTCDEVRQEICKLTEGVVRVILYPNADDRSKNRGFAFVEYKSHPAATAARRKLIPGQVTMWGTPIEVDWAEPEQEPDEEVIAKVKNLYVRNLVAETTEADLKKIFESITGPDTVEHVKKLKDFAFVHFMTKEDASLALSKGNGLQLDGADIEVVWAKPVDKAQRQLRTIQQHMSSTFCNNTSSSSQHQQQNQQNLLHQQNGFGFSMPVHVPLMGHLATGQNVVVNGGAAGLGGSVAASGVFSTPFLKGGGAGLHQSPTSFVLTTTPTMVGGHHTAFLTSSATSSPAGSSTVGACGTPPGAATLSGGGSPQSNAAQYVGFPFIDPTASGGNVGMTSSSAAANLGGGGGGSALLRSLNARNRCAAGMRSAGYQSNVNSVNRRFGGRKKFTEPQLANTGLTTFACPTNFVFLPTAAQSLPLADIFNGHAVWKQPENMQNQHISNGAPQATLANDVPYKSHYQVLHDFCRTNSWSLPQYQETVTSSKDAMGQSVSMYVYKVTIDELTPLYGHFVRYDRPSVDPEEAREKAAYFVLLQLGYNFNNQLFESDKRYVYPQLVHQLPLVPYFVPSDFSGFYATAAPLNHLPQPHHQYQPANQFIENPTVATPHQETDPVVDRADQPQPRQQAVVVQLTA